MEKGRDGIHPEYENRELLLMFTSDRAQCSHFEHFVSHFRARLQNDPFRLFARRSQNQQESSQVVATGN